jgi:hypothetical protein
MEEKPFLVKLKKWLFISFVIVFFIYFIFRIFNFLSGPIIKIYSPINGQRVDSDTFIVEGNVKNVKNIFLNGREIAIDEDGDFKEILIAKPPYTVIVISAYDKYGKSKEKILEISKN